MTVTNEEMIVEIKSLDDKGAGRASVWRENEHGNQKKLRLTIPQVLLEKKFVLLLTSQNVEEEGRLLKSKIDKLNNKKKELNLELNYVEDVEELLKYIKMAN